MPRRVVRPGTAVGPAKNFTAVPGLSTYHAATGGEPNGHLVVGGGNPMVPNEDQAEQPRRIDVRAVVTAGVHAAMNAAGDAAGCAPLDWAFQEGALGRLELAGHASCAEVLIAEVLAPWVVALDLATREEPLPGTVEFCGQVNLSLFAVAPRHPLSVVVWGVTNRAIFEGGGW